MNDREITLWLDERRAAALEAALETQGSSLEKHLQDYLIDLYTGQVPSARQREIDSAIDAERIQAAQEKETARVLSAFRVTQHGKTECFASETGYEFLEAAQKLRAYLRRPSDAQEQPFRATLARCSLITQEQFDALTLRRMDNTGKVAGAFDIDFDKREFSAVHIMDGWRTYAIGDVSAAAYHAGRRSGLSEPERWSQFLDKLEGKAIASAGHLSARELIFEDEICEIDDRLNFYIRTGFDVDAVFGTFVATDANDDFLNIYADYDMPTGSVCDTLDVILHRGDGSEEEFSYTLNAAEKEVLLHKMDAYCQSRTGRTLEAYSKELMERDQSPMLAPQA